jgi:AcrR family transcriptional regulator
MNIKERILEVLTELSEREAYPNVSASQLAKAAKVSRPLIYYYYKNMDTAIYQMLEAAIISGNEIIIQQGKVNRHELFS